MGRCEIKSRGSVFSARDSSVLESFEYGVGDFVVVTCAEVPGKVKNDNILEVISRDYVSVFSAGRHVGPAGGNQVVCHGGLAGVSVDVPVPEY